MKRARWFWLLVPVIAVGAALAVPAPDDFADLAREGKPVALKDVSTALYDPFYKTFRTFAARPGERVRSWSLPLALDECRRHAEARGFALMGSASVAETGKAGKRFLLRTVYMTDPTVGSRLALADGAKLPKGVGCFAVAYEPTGLSVAWRRLAARTKRAFAR